jgi:DNA processing protein
MQNNETDIESCLRLVRDQRWSLRQKRRLLDNFGSSTKVYEQSADTLRQCLPVKWSNSRAAISTRQIRQDLVWLQQPHHHLLQPSDPHFPKLLTNISDPPIALFAIGDTQCLNDPQVAVVGSRRPTPGGQRLTHCIARDLAKLGIIITSGMALGVDGFAHKAALENNGKTVAVMGCGLDIVYPRRHNALFEDISERGCVLSELPLGVPVSRYAFPKRNRIVCGMSLGVVIIEAAERSGTLITARLALEQDRSVMVVPGSALNPQYFGSHQLLRDGAALVSSAEDVVRELQVPLQSALEDLSTNESKTVVDAPQSSLLEHIDWESTTIDSIISASGLTAAEVSSMLLTLEIDGAVTLSNDGGYVRIR